MKTFFVLLIPGLLLLFYSCKKNRHHLKEDPHNYPLYNKSISQLKSGISGRWQLQRYEYQICGFAGCDTSNYTYEQNKGDYIIFGNQDSVIKVRYDLSLYYIKEIAQIERIKNRDPSLKVDSIYRYSLQNGFTAWVMQEIKNDTLVIKASPYTYYCLRK